MHAGVIHVNTYFTRVVSILSFGEYLVGPFKEHDAAY